jgi:RNA polymerase sigma factor (TIGR02999 family)
MTMTSPDAPKGVDGPGDITLCLLALRQGGRSEMDALFSLVYNRLRLMARSRLRATGGQTLDATALVHEAFLRFVDATRLDFHDRQHFFAVAGRAMRQIAVDHARRRLAAKRGGGLVHTTDPDGQATRETPLDEVLAIDEALARLADTSPRLVEVVELCFFAGLTTDEAGEALGVTGRTVKREWQKARILLQALLRDRRRPP